MKQFIEVNTNDKIRYVLSSKYPDIEGHTEDVPEEGWEEAQIWDFMLQYGNKMCMGFKPIVWPSVRIQVETSSLTAGD